MKRTRYAPDQDKMFTRWMLLLCIVGLCINLILSSLVTRLGLPLYLDNVGSVIVAVLGGSLPGMFIGFLTNILKSVSNPISMYYGILTVLIAWVGYLFSSHGLLRSFKGFVLMALSFALIGGSIGSCFTWFLYGGSFGEDITGQLARQLYAGKIPQFWAQFIAASLLDIPDKFLTVLPVYFLTRFYPHQLYDKFPLSYVYDRSEEKRLHVPEDIFFHIRRHSINFKITGIIITVAALIGGVSSAVGLHYYKNQLFKDYQREVTSYAKLAASVVPADQVGAYLARGQEAPGYEKTKEELQRIRDYADGLTYLYVYQFQGEDCTVVFDLDVPSMKGEATGSRIPFDESFAAYRTELFAGQEIPPLVTHDQYGWLITSYVPIRNAAGETVAYVGADMGVAQIISEIEIYVIRTLAIIFGMVILFAAFSLWFAQRKIVDPIHTILAHSREFKKSDPEKWLESGAWENRRKIDTGDEIEELYATVCDSEAEIAMRVKALHTTQLKLQESEALKQKNEELAKAVEQANAANEAKTTFLSNISHDIRTPLNGIIGMSYLARKQDNPPETTECLNKIDTSSQFLLGLVNDVLDMAKAESNKIELHPEPYSARKFLNYLDAVIVPLCKEKNLKFVLDAQPLRGMVAEMDILRINQIVFNLLSNAVKYTPEGGTIVFRLREKMAGQGRLAIEAKVHDNGIGMTREFQKVLFEPFTQEGRSDVSLARGSGLGLAIVKKMVDLMQGTIEVESQEGVGTTFTFHGEFMCVPVTEVNREEEEKEQQEHYDRLTGRHILVCEDHPLNQEIARKLLEEKGMQAVIAEDGQKGVTLFTESLVGYYDAVLMDIRMPVMNGYDAAKAIRNLERPDAGKVPIIAMTADAFADDVEKCLAAGMDGHIAKPINPDGMYRELMKVLR